MSFRKQENFIDDGRIFYKKGNAEILYDFEKRFSYYDSHGGFRFKSLGQFERKIRKTEIELSIQCSKNEDGFLIAWHEDYMEEAKESIGSKTGSGRKEYNLKRFTTDFVELSYDEFDKFYDILVFAFKNNAFNKNSFSVFGKGR